MCLFTLPAFDGYSILPTYPQRDGSRWVDLGAWSVPRWFTRPKTVTHPGNNLAWGWVTTLIDRDQCVTTKPTTKPTTAKPTHWGVLSSTFLLTTKYRGVLLQGLDEAPTVSHLSREVTAAGTIGSVRYLSTSAPSCDAPRDWPPVVLCLIRGPARPLLGPAAFRPRRFDTVAAMSKKFHSGTCWRWWTSRNLPDWLPAAGSLRRRSRLRKMLPLAQHLQQRWMIQRPRGRLARFKQT